MTHLGVTYALVNPDNQIMEFRNDIDPNLPVKTGFKWLDIVDSGRPIYNMDTQNIFGPLYTVYNDHINKYWNVVDKTQEEIDSEINSRIQAGQYNLQLFLLYENKFRSLNSQPELTMEEYISYIKDNINV